MFADDALLYKIWKAHKIMQDVDKMEVLGQLCQVTFNNNKYSVLSLNDDILQLPSYLNTPGF